ncbi:MAG: bifunctional riboflavin kinase/FAD synthetase [Deltaproteobacteria bacterium]
MKAIFDPDTPPASPVSATIGVFDGVHLGHRQIIRLVREDALIRRAASCVITFDPHPQRVLHQSQIPLIVPFRERLALFEAEGVDLAVCYNFTREFASISAEDFVANKLVGALGIKSIFVGADFTFGRKREGNIGLLRAMGAELGFEVNTVSPVHLGDELISSTAIRGFIQEGMVGKAARFLGRNFYIEGTIKEGEKRGRLLGFPTANLDADWELLPMKGVYATWAWINGIKRKSITNIGFRPTFNASGLLIETHVFDFSADLYGRRVKVEFAERLRDERRFESVEALTAQIARDVLRSREILAAAE